MAWGYAAVAGATLVGGYLQSQAAGNAAQQQSAAAQHAADLQYQMFQQQQSNQQPWMQAGKQSLSQLGQLTGPGGQMSQMPTAYDVMSQMAPNYQFQLAQGMGQAQNQMNATGGLMSGNEMQGLNTFAQNFAGNAYQNAFNNYQTGQTNIFNRLAAIAGLGQTSAGNVMNAGMGTAAGMGNYLTSGAAAQAAGQVGQANALTQGLSNLGGLYFAKQNNLFGQPGGQNAGGGGMQNPAGTVTTVSYPMTSQSYPLGQGPVAQP